MDYQITLSDMPSSDDLRILQEGYQAFTEAQIGEEDRRQLAFFLRDAQGAVLGGVKGSFGNYGWLWIDLLWVSEENRKQGHGARLMANIEAEAYRQGCLNAYLNSFSFQAVEFYRKIGYRVFGEMKNFPPGHSVCCMSKALGK